MNCPAGYLRRRPNEDQQVVVCNILMEKILNGEKVEVPHFEVLPYHCENYMQCDIWREEKEKDWKRKAGKKYSSMKQAETIRL